MVAIPSPPTYQQRAVSSFANALEKQTSLRGPDLPHWRQFVAEPHNIFSWAALVSDLRETGVCSKGLLELRRQWWAQFSTWRAPSSTYLRPYDPKHSWAEEKSKALTAPVSDPLKDVELISDDLRTLLDAMIQRRPIVVTGALTLFNDDHWGPIDFSRLNQGVWAYPEDQGQEELLRDLSVTLRRGDIDSKLLHSLYPTLFPALRWNVREGHWLAPHWEQHNQRKKCEVPQSLLESAGPALGLVLDTILNCGNEQPPHFPEVPQSDVPSLKDSAFEESPFFKYLSDHWEKIGGPHGYPVDYRYEIIRDDFSAVLAAAGLEVDHTAYWLWRKSAGIARALKDPQESRFLHYLAQVLEASGWTEDAMKIHWRASRGYRNRKMNSLFQWDAQNNAASTALKRGDREARDGAPGQAMTWYKAAELIGYIASNRDDDMGVYGKAVDDPKSRLRAKRQRSSRW